MNANLDSTRRGIYVFAGPVLGWIGYTIAELLSHGPRSLGFMLIGLVIFYPITFIVGSMPAMAAFYVDQALYDRRWPKVWRCFVSCTLGGLLSFPILLVFHLPFPELQVTGAFLCLPGAFAGVVCSWWTGELSDAAAARQLRLWLGTLSPSDLSVNEAAAARPGSTMITEVGSANEALWSQMEHAGWTQQITTDALSVPSVTSAYTLTESGSLAMMKALAELVSWNTQILEASNSFDLRTAPEHVRQLSSLVGRLTLRTAAQLAIAKMTKPATGEAKARQRDYILALDEIGKGLLTAEQHIAEALVLGPESDAGSDRLERTSKALRYAEQCLTEWATEMRVKQSRPASITSAASEA